MAESKKYYYMRLQEGYFDSDEQILLESMPDGYLYSNILLKLYLKSLKRNGLLMFNERIPYNAQMIATITRHQIGTVEKAMEIFQQLGIVEVLDSGAIYMMDVQNYVGKTSTKADRIRAYRAKVEEEKNKAQPLPESTCTNKQDSLYICTPEKEKEKEKEKDSLYICTPEKEIEKEIEIEKEKEKKTIMSVSDETDCVDSPKKQKNKELYSEIVSYLNKKAGTKYRPSTPKTQALIRARESEGFSLDDFKIVIDKKCAEWIGDERMEQYLRPETLFGTKFEAYLNAKPSKRQTDTGITHGDQNDLDDLF